MKKIIRKSWREINNDFCMSYIIKCSSNARNDIIVDVVLLLPINASTEMPEEYVEEYQRVFHQFCTDVLCFMQGLESEKMIKVLPTFSKGSTKLPLGYRKAVRQSMPESYYIPFSCYVDGKLATASVHQTQVRISTHSITGREGEAVLEYTIKDWNDIKRYPRHLRAIQHNIIDGISDRIEEIREYRKK